MNRLALSFTRRAADDPHSRIPGTLLANPFKTMFATPHSVTLRMIETLHRSLITGGVNIAAWCPILISRTLRN